MDEARLERALGVRILGTRNANHARVFVVQNGGDPFYAKAPVPWLFDRLSPAERWDEARHVNEVTATFYRLLSGNAVPLPDVYDMMIQEDGYPLHLISDEGTDCAEILELNPWRIREIVEGIIDAIARLLLFGGGQVGMDPLLSNFALNGNGFRYIDIFPPLVLFNGAHVVHYPNPDDPQVIRREVNRKFTAFGILRRLRFELISRELTWEAVFFEVLREKFGSAIDHVLQRFADLPDVQLSDPNLSYAQRSELFATVDLHDVDGLREFAAKVIPLKGEERRTMMAQVFDLTSFVRAKSPENFLERVGRYRKIVSRYLQADGTAAH